MAYYHIGLDISTSITGISIFKNKEFLEMNHIDLAKVKSYFKKADKVRDYFESIRFEDCDKLAIGVEENLQAFRPGMSSAKTLMQLSRFNGVVSQIAYEIFSIEPIYINVNKARKALQIKISKESGKNTKEQVLDWVSKDLKDTFVWPDKILKSGPNKGRVKLKNCCYDMADAYVICKALLDEEIYD